jgi:hypothetical protein
MNNNTLTLSNKTTGEGQYLRFQEIEEEKQIKVRKQQDRLIKQIYCCILTALPSLNRKMSPIKVKRRHQRQDALTFTSSHNNEIQHKLANKQEKLP